ncbi:hypothetical protein [Bremerella sp.]|uniref:hypothetical protein n=1 Tax=Bremerella sp. TaxID=2795602 RepID=UPI00391D1FEA
MHDIARIGMSLKVIRDSAFEKLPQTPLEALPGSQKIWVVEPTCIFLRVIFWLELAGSFWLVTLHGMWCISKNLGKVGGLVAQFTIFKLTGKTRSHFSQGLIIWNSLKGKIYAGKL